MCVLRRCLSWKANQYHSDEEKKTKTEGLMEVFFDHHLYFILKELRAKQSRTMCSEKPVIKWRTANVYFLECDRSITRRFLKNKEKASEKSEDSNNSFLATESVKQLRHDNWTWFWWSESAFILQLYFQFSGLILPATGQQAMTTFYI